MERCRSGAPKEGERKNDVFFLARGQKKFKKTTTATKAVRRREKNKRVTNCPHNNPVYDTVRLTVQRRTLVRSNPSPPQKNPCFLLPVWFVDELFSPSPLRRRQIVVGIFLLLSPESSFVLVPRPGKLFCPLLFFRVNWFGRRTKSLFFSQRQQFSQKSAPGLVYFLHGLELGREGKQPCGRQPQIIQIRGRGEKERQRLLVCRKRRRQALICTRECGSNFILPSRPDPKLKGGLLAEKGGSRVVPKLGSHVKKRGCGAV